MARRRRPPSQGWKTFLHNHADAIASIDMFVVPTISFGLLLPTQANLGRSLDQENAPRASSGLQFDIALARAQIELAARLR
jgi:hypothetical protein